MPFHGSPVDDAVLVDHPALRGPELRAEAEAKRASSEGGLPPPQLSTEVWQVPWDQPYRVDKAGSLWVTLSQDIPATALLDLTKGPHEAGQEMERAARFAESIRLVSEARAAWLDVVRRARMHAVHLQHREIIGRIRAIAVDRVATGGGVEEVALADLEAAELDAQIARALGDLDNARERLNALLRHPPGAQIDIAGDEGRWTAGVTLDEALAVAHASSGPLRVARAAARRAHVTAQASELAVTVPDFGVAWETFLPTNGQKVGWGAMIRMTLPWVWNGERGGARADAIDARASDADVSAAQTTVDTAVRTAFEQVRAAERRLRVIASKVEPAAAHAVEVSTAGYASGTVPLERTLRASEGLLDARDMRVDAEGDLAASLNDLDTAVGVEVKRAPFDLDEVLP